MLLSEMDVKIVAAAKPKVRSLTTHEIGIVYQVVRLNDGAGATIAIQWTDSNRVAAITHKFATTIEVMQPYWRIDQLHNLKPNFIWETNGHFGNAVAAGMSRPRLAIAPAPLLEMIEPAAVMELLTLMRGSMSEEKLYFRNREEFEQAQLKLESLIRQYGNLV